MDKTQIFVLESHSDIETFIRVLQTLDKNIDHNRLFNIINNMIFPLSIVFEPYYVDKLYRDTYYLYYSSKHYEYSRNCRRLSFFDGDFQLKDFYDLEKLETLNDALIGTVVLRPLNRRTIGRTLIDPSKLKNVSAYIRTTDFSVEILGNVFTINAFPFLSQDGEVMTCAETTVWNIVEYYGTRYPEYKTVLPNDIISKLDEISSERILPSRGLDYLKITNLLKEFSFSPRLYADSIYDINILKMLFHYYVESGIPLALGVQGKNNGSIVRHSIICIGHAAKQLQLNDITIYHEDSVSYIDSSQLYNEYVVIDDNQIPYVIEDFNDLTLYEDSKLCVFAAPLYKRIFLEAGDAYNVVYELLRRLNIWKFIKDNTPEISDDNPIVVRLFLTTSRKYKNYRVHHICPEALSEIYSQISFPKFLWVAEISTYELYQKQKILGEIVIDATSTRNDLSDSVVMIKYKSLFGYSDIHKITEYFTNNICTYDNLDKPYDMYINNLKEIL